MNESMVNTESSGQDAPGNTSPKLKISDFKLPIIERLEDNPSTSVGDLIEMLKARNFDCTPQTVKNNLKTWGYEFSTDSNQWSKIEGDKNQNPPAQKTEQLNQIEEPTKTAPEPAPEVPKEAKKAGSAKSSKKKLRGTTLSLNLSDKEEKSPLISIRPSRPNLAMETRGRRRTNQIDPLSSISDETQNSSKPKKKPTKETADESLKGIVTKKPQKPSKNKKLDSRILTDSETDNREKALQEALERDAERIQSKRGKSRTGEVDALTTPSPQPEPEADQHQLAEPKAESDEMSSEEVRNRDESVEEAKHRDIYSDSGDSSPDTDRKAKPIEPLVKPEFDPEAVEAQPEPNRRNRDPRNDKRNVSQTKPATKGNKKFVFESIYDVYTHIKEQLDISSNKKKVSMLFAFNSSGKTRLSQQFYSKNKKIVIYFNAFTEDMFFWDNRNFILKIQENKGIIKTIQNLGLEYKVIAKFKKLTGLNIEIKFDIKEGQVEFFREETNIKISRSEERIFIWSVYYTILESTIEELNKDSTIDAFKDIEYVVIDDPVSSIDDTRIITIALDLAELISKSEKKLKFLILTHHPLFFNVLFKFRKEDQNWKRKNYLLSVSDTEYILDEQSNESPFAYHHQIISEIIEAITEDQLKKYHFNQFRALLEKTANFLGYRSWKKLNISALEGAHTFIKKLDHFSHDRLEELDLKELTVKEVDEFKEVFLAFINEFNWDESNFKIPK